MPRGPLILGGSRAQKQERINISKGGISVERGGRYDMLYEETVHENLASVGESWHGRGWRLAIRRV